MMRRLWINLKFGTNTSKKEIILSSLIYSKASFAVASSVENVNTKVYPSIASRTFPSQYLIYVGL